MTKITLTFPDFHEASCKLYTSLFNLVISMIGFTMVGLGMWMKYNLNKVGVPNVDCLINVPWLSIIFGLGVILSGFIGYYLLKKSMFLFMYASCLFVIFIFGLSLGTVALIVSSRITDSVMNTITIQMENYLSNPKGVMDRLQFELKCCGNTEPSDWLRTSAGQIPPSCCKMKLCDPTRPEEVYSEGCFQVLVRYIRHQIHIISITVIALSLIPCIGCVIMFVIAQGFVQENYQAVQ